MCPHIFLAVPYLMFAAARGKDRAVRDAAEDALVQLRGFAKDIVDSGYKIRTKDSEGAPYIPEEDLASFVQYESLIENGECTAKLSAALVGYGDSQGLDCGLADGNDYEAFATARHYYNYAIVQTFHLSAIANALMNGQNQAAERLLRGQLRRLDRYMDPEADEPGWEDERWLGDLAVYLVQASALGAPLSAAQVRHVHDRFLEAMSDYRRFERWDLWSQPDGVYEPRGGYKPTEGEHRVGIDEMASLMLPCFSPFSNPSSAPLLDCARLRDRVKR